ncbi:hypothetical protein [Streptomyces sp. DASNCL29]|uniref:hypothetical protein n=1 Tax=Streptomyces sp. DASNCL29 TaxID=2583819 RepID=UPI00110FF046|nr:hypothetical protein [Streptomyces sp. DASNCL29]TMU93809.1 hypothetical protein FGK60_31130 [Streptomyces sp. DASNCL29]
MVAVTVIAVPAGPAAAVPPGGYAFVANLGSDTVSMINTSTKAVTTAGVGTYPMGVATAMVRAPAPTCAKATATITGTDGSDVITGTSGDDVIFALGGNGNDVLLGGVGDNTNDGGAGVNVCANPDTGPGC